MWCAKILKRPADRLSAWAAMNTGLLASARPTQELLRNYWQVATNYKKGRLRLQKVSDRRDDRINATATPCNQFKCRCSVPNAKRMCGVELLNMSINGENVSEPWRCWTYRVPHLLPSAMEDRWRIVYIWEWSISIHWSVERTAIFFPI